MIMDLTAILIAKIFNPALSSISAKSLTGITDTSTEAVKCKENYESVRNAETRERIWTCTKKTILIDVDATEPVDEIWDYRYLEPTDSNYLISLFGDDDFTIESGYILTNSIDVNDQVGARYVQIADIDTGSALDEEVTRWDSGLINVMILRMAATLSLALSKKSSTREGAWVLYDRGLNSSMLANDFEDRHDRVHRTEEETPWISKRWAD